MTDERCSAANEQEITSIISRLRNFAVWNSRHSHYDPVPLCKEAADLIERIRAVPQEAPNRENLRPFAEWADRNRSAVSHEAADELILLARKACDAYGPLSRPEPQTSLMQAARNVVKHLEQNAKPYCAGVVADCIAEIERLRDQGRWIIDLVRDKFDASDKQDDGAVMTDENHMRDDAQPTLNSQLAEFFTWAMREGPWGDGDLDGGSVHDKAESLGLIVKTQYDSEKHGMQCDLEKGDDYFVFAPNLLAAQPLAAPQSCSAATVQVRPLEWDEGKGELAGQLVWSSGDPWVFWIVKNPNEKYIWCENFNIEGFCPCSPVRGSYDTLDEAKAAAQADYDERIRAAVILNEPQEVPERSSGHRCKRAGGFVDSGCNALCDCHVTLALPRPEPQPAPHPDETVNFNGRLVTWAEIDAAVRKRNAALARPEPQEAWQPIETAKRKDGTRIQAWDGKKQFICHFRGEHHEPHQDKPGWFEQHIRMHPTHWKPLGPSPLSRPQRK